MMQRQRSYRYVVASVAAFSILWGGHAYAALEFESLTDWFAANGNQAAPDREGSGEAPAAPSTGGLTFFTDRASFDAAAPGLPCEDFEEGNVAPGGVVGCPSPLDSSSNNACFVPGDILDGIRFETPANPANGIALLGSGFFGTSSKTITANFFVDPFDVFFPGILVTAAGMDLTNVLGGPTVNITIYGPGGVVLGNTVAAATPAGSFWGVLSSQAITRINIADPAGGSEGVDNICFTHGVRAPALSTLGFATLILLLVGMSGLVFRRRSRVK